MGDANNRTVDDDNNNNKENLTNREYKEIIDQWMIRPCRVYDEEYSDCTSIKGRFHQYFVYGETQDCSQWKRDSINCYKWQDEKDMKAANEIVQGEKIRRKQRLLPHYQNDVWEKRKTPPEDWNKPLPDYMTKEYEYSYLNIKSKEMKGEIPPQFDPDWKYCAIM